MLEMIGAIVALVAALLGVGTYAKGKRDQVKKLEKDIEVAEKLGRLEGRIDRNAHDAEYRERVRNLYQRKTDGDRGGDNASKH